MLNEYTAVGLKYGKLFWERDDEHAVLESGLVQSISIKLVNYSVLQLSRRRVAVCVCACVIIIMCIYGPRNIYCAGATSVTAGRIGLFSRTWYGKDA